MIVLLIMSHTQTQSTNVKSHALSTHIWMRLLSHQPVLQTLVPNTSLYKPMVGVLLVNKTTCQHHLLSLTLRLLFTTLECLQGGVVSIVA
jgi:hypothetical protein